MNILRILLLLIIPLNIAAQSFQVFKGDTINRKDEAGRKQGLWRKYYPTDTLYSETFFKNDMPVGVSRTWYDTGKLKAEVTFGRNNRGKGISYFESGKVMARGLYNGTEKDSTWIYYHEKADTISAIENYLKGHPHGKWKVFYENGVLAHEITYENGKKAGLVRQYNDDGKLIFEINYVNGVEDGPSAIYYPDGKVREKGSYKNGEREGKWQSFDEKGALQKETIYKNGVEEKKD